MAGDVADVVAASALFQDLTPEEITDLAAGLTMRRFAPGEALMIQGGDSDGAFVLAAGVVRVTAALPGGGETTIAELGAGDLVGEMALLMRGGKRTATARAVEAVDALHADRRYFEATLHMLKPSSLKVLRRLGVMTAQRLRAIRDRSRSLVDQAHDGDLFRRAPEPDDRSSDSFRVRDFLTILPCLEDFEAPDLDTMFKAASVVEVSRGAVLGEEGAAGHICRLVVRGALMLCHRSADRVHQLDILGPGRFAGIGPLLDERPVGASVVAAENTTLLSFPAETFMGWWLGGDTFALRVLDAVNADLVRSLDTASRHLTRLTAQERVREFAESG